VIAGTVPGTEDRIPLLPHEVDGVTLLIAADVHAVFRQLDAAHWMSANSTKTDPAALRRLVLTATLG
jgi:hypothetical protein